MSNRFQISETNKYIRGYNISIQEDLLNFMKGDTYIIIKFTHKAGRLPYGTSNYYETRPLLDGNIIKTNMTAHPAFLVASNIYLRSKAHNFLQPSL